MLKKSFYSLLFLSLLFSCKNKEVKEVSQKITTVKSYTYTELKPLLEKKDGKTYVVNFWATWCAPCVKELPAFEKLNQEYAAKNVEVILVSLDFPKQIDKRLIPFINKNNLQSKVVLLNDVNEDVWIKAIDATWSGALPATLIYNAKGRKFYEQSFDYEKLETELQSFL
ncbi:TlpA disulfide reductase family protein [Polaribacter sp. L3A8]|uniref:TlpA disulfide reductase family protein n=1 Tax=Polaribacter sp. L3A8 TaxID=2686361 RepID=UPI00131D8176|nr:TlpA disulfide reductase family protein [Polaribacter sp. L3A8]